MEKAILSGGKKVAALLLAALLAFSMFGCGGDEDTSVWMVTLVFVRHLI